MITLKEIAAQCNVSIATVSNILNGKDKVSKETKEKVLQLIKETGYKPNYMARGLRATKTRTIGLLIDDLTEFSSPLIVDGIMTYLEENNYKSILENLRFYSKWGYDWYQNDAYKKAVYNAFQEFSAIKVDGIIYVSGHERNINIIPENFSIPTIISYAFSDSPNISSVMIDDVDAAYRLTEHLIKNGHKKIAIIKGENGNIHTEKRLQGYKKALKDYGIALDQDLICDGNWRSQSGYEMGKELLDSKKDFSAIFCFNDLMAAGLYRCLAENNIKVGTDLSVVGFDNRTISKELIPPLTTMEIPLAEIGKETAQELLKQITAEEEFNKQELYIKCNLIERDSVSKK
ncbi:MAG: LacI family transcriptional regulator [Treponema sp.]|nr:LacI family transcriptional regulator [Treponema sp.]